MHSSRFSLKPLAYRALPTRLPVRCMAQQTAADVRRQPRRENVDGAFFVDHTCIDCDTCRWMSSSVFKRAGEQSAVTKQPENEDERFASMQALLACPTSSIHVQKVQKGELKQVQSSFPIPLPHSTDLFYNGYTDEKSFAAYSYFIKSPNGNVMVDCPRYNPPLIKRLDEMGGFDFIFLTHIDDVGDHAKWAKRYGAKRIIHQKEVNHNTRDCEIQLEGGGPWTVGENGDLDEIELIHTPGHTAGSVCLYHKPSQSIFTGDHFGYTSRTWGLTVFPRYNGYSVKIQLESLKKMLDYDFLRVYPGHGRRVEYPSLEERNAHIKAFLKEQGH